jgi:tRNA uridine 5-carbamoylmethylation protein Kti12
VFTDFMPKAIGLMAEEVVVAREMNRDIVWDQTNTTVARRAKKFRMLPDYEHIAVVFATPEPADLVMRLNSRYDSGKIIPDQVVQDMINNWEEPTLEEGFTEIWRV